MSRYFSGLGKWISDFSQSLTGSRLGFSKKKCLHGKIPEECEICVRDEEIEILKAENELWKSALFEAKELAKVQDLSIQKMKRILNEAGYNPGKTMNDLANVVGGIVEIILEVRERKEKEIGETHIIKTSVPASESVIWGEDGRAIGMRVK